MHVWTSFQRIWTNFSLTYTRYK